MHFPNPRRDAKMTMDQSRNLNTECIFDGVGFGSSGCNVGAAVYIFVGFEVWEFVGLGVDEELVGF